MTQSTLQTIFPRGIQIPEGNNFTGEVWLQPLVNPDDTYTTASGHVEFECCARTDWHTHPGGQILIVTAGEGYHQIKGQPREIIRKGDVVQCPPDVEHWHGATENSAMAHLYIVTNTEKGIVDWKEAVSDAEFLGKDEPNEAD